MQWWERPPPTNVTRLQLPALTPYVGWVCCWFSPLLREIFPQILRFPLSSKPTLPNSNSTWDARTRLNEFIWTPMCFVVNKLQFTIFFFSAPPLIRVSSLHYHPVGVMCVGLRGPPFFHVKEHTKRNLIKPSLYLRDSVGWLFEAIQHTLNLAVLSYLWISLQQPCLRSHHLHHESASLRPSVSPLVDDISKDTRKHFETKINNRTDTWRFHGFMPSLSKDIKEIHMIRGNV